MHVRPNVSCCCWRSLGLFSGWIVLAVTSQLTASTLQMYTVKTSSSSWTLTSGFCVDSGTPRLTNGRPSWACTCRVRPMSGRWGGTWSASSPTPVTTSAAMTTTSPWWSWTPTSPSTRTSGPSVCPRPPTTSPPAVRRGSPAGAPTEKEVMFRQHACLCSPLEEVMIGQYFR